MWGKKYRATPYCISIRNKLFYDLSDIAKKKSMKMFR